MIMQNMYELQAKQIVPGIAGRYLHGDGQTIGYVEIEKGSILPEHQHVHEQITFIIKGSLEMTIGGVVYNLTEGFAHVIPGNTPHSAIAHEDCIAIDVFNPVREDYR